MRLSTPPAVPVGLASPLSFFALLLFFLALASAPPVQAQDPDEETEDVVPDTLLAPPWSLSLAGKLSASQVAYSNWTEGGVSTLALTTGIDGKAQRAGETWTQTHELRLAFGFLKQDTLDVRKADDLIRLASSFQYKGEGFFSTFNPTISATARSQFAAGFAYDEVPDELQNETGARAPPVQVSGFLAPSTFTETVGLSYEPADWLVQRFGVAGKQTVVRLAEVRPLYGLAPDRLARVEAGLHATTELDREVLENVRVQSTLSLFAAFNQASELPDATWENVVTMLVNRYLSVNLEFTTLYDRDISPDVQIKEVLSLGITLVVI